MKFAPPPPRKPPHLIEKRVNPPWHNDAYSQVKKRPVPWEMLRWEPVVTTGGFTRTRDVFSLERKGPEGEVTKVNVKTEQTLDGVPAITYGQMVSIFNLMDETDCTFMEAYIDMVGVGKLPPDWVTRALQSIKIRSKTSKHLKQNAIPEMEEPPEVTFVSPREKLAKEKASAPGKPAWKKAALDQQGI